MKILSFDSRAEAAHHRDGFAHRGPLSGGGIYPRKEYPHLTWNIRVEDNVFTEANAPSAFDFTPSDPTRELSKCFRESGNQFQP